MKNPLKSWFVYVFVCGFFIAFFLLFPLPSPSLYSASDISFISDVGEEGISPYMENLGKVRKMVASAPQKERVKVLRFAANNGFSKEEALTYAFPEIMKEIDALEKKLFIPFENASFESIKGTGKIKITPAKKGRKLNKEKLIESVFEGLLSGKEDLKFIAKSEETNFEVGEEEVKNNSLLRGGFETAFEQSSDERKNNIRLAAASLDGKIILPGETLSFNEATGERDEKSGYQKAKIIKNGMYVSEFGGGVCQVSTTLYNAALLSDLEIVEVHPHSLPVSYVKPCFDAMVNMGSCDLIIRNNLSHPVIISTSTANDKCLINIYGSRNKYKIVRNSEKITDLLQIKTEKTKNYKEFGLEKPLEEGEERVISSGKPGFVARGTLVYFEDGAIVKTKKIRENTYQAAKRVILVG